MSRLVAAEWRKVFTTKLWWGMLLGAVAFVALGVVAQIASNGGPRSELPPLSTAVTQQSLFATSAGGYVFSIIVGVIMMSTEYRHFTSRPTFLTTPHRGRVILAKLLVAFAVGAFYGAVCVAVTCAIAVPWLGAKGVSINWTANDLLLVLLGGGASVCIYATVGVGIGVLLRNQIAGVMASLAFLLVVEPLIAITPYIQEAYRYTPAGAAAAVTTYGTLRRNVQVVDPWQGALLLLGWGLLFAVLGWLITLRRDID